MTTRNPTLAEVINAATDSALGDLFISLPAKVTRYDAATQQVDAQPIPKVRHTDELGADVVESLPIVPSVPVVFPGGGGFTVTFPIQVGDVVLLVFSGASLDKWLESGSDDALDPETHARHRLTDAVAVPGLKNFRRPRQSAPTDHVRVGVDGASAQGAALGATLQAYLDDLKSAIDDVRDKLRGHVHSSFGTSPTGSATPNPAFVVDSIPTPPDVESDSVKITE